MKLTRRSFVGLFSFFSALIPSFLRANPKPITLAGWKVDFRSAVLNPDWKCRIEPAMGGVEVAASLQKVLEQLRPDLKPVVHFHERRPPGVEVSTIGYKWEEDGIVWGDWIVWTKRSFNQQGVNLLAYRIVEQMALCSGSGRFWAKDFLAVNLPPTHIMMPLEDRFVMARSQVLEDGRVVALSPTVR